MREVSQQAWVIRSLRQTIERIGWLSLKGAEVVTGARRPSVHVEPCNSRNENPPDGRRSRGWLVSLAFKSCNPAGVLPKLDVVTVNHSLGAFLRSVVIIANEIDGLNEMIVAANQVSSIVRHGRSLSDTDGQAVPVMELSVQL